MKTEHTPTPWRLFRMSGVPFSRCKTIEIQSDYKYPVVSWAGFDSCFTPIKERRANARRIVACVNACENISTEIIEQNANKVCILLTQRDQLLAVLENVVAWADPRRQPPANSFPKWFEDARALIASIGGDE